MFCEGRTLTLWLYLRVTDRINLPCTLEFPSVPKFTWLFLILLIDGRILFHGLSFQMTFLKQELHKHRTKTHLFQTQSYRHINQRCNPRCDWSIDSTCPLTMIRSFGWMTSSFRTTVRTHRMGSSDDWIFFILLVTGKYCSNCSISRVMGDTLKDCFHPTF